ncbi:hypothetical protein T484DRAFT_2027196 [Baffinella frigidus]|nr:hypothetical protein T484DRAFT_2027196 [Cryptophyta sp. CCMP2293]
MVSSEIHGGSALISNSNNKTSSDAPLATANKWASVLDQDVMAQALAAVRAHRSQKQAVEPKAHAPSYSAWGEEATPSEAAPLNLPAELPPQAIAVRRASLQAQQPQGPRRANTATRVFSAVTAQWRSTASSSWLSHARRSKSPRPVRSNTW